MAFASFIKPGDFILSTDIVEISGIVQIQSDPSAAPSIFCPVTLNLDDLLECYFQESHPVEDEAENHQEESPWIWARIMAILVTALASSCL